MPTPKEYRAKDGTPSWKVRFREAGRSSSITFADEVAARRFARDIEVGGVQYAVARFEEQAADDRAPTLDEVFERWITWKAARLRSDRTPADWRRDWRNSVSPALGDRRVDLITEADVQTWVDLLHTRGIGPNARPLAPKTVHMRASLLRSVCSWASSPRQGIMRRDPTDGMDLPRIRKAQPKGLRPIEWAGLEAQLRALSPDAADLAAFTLATGMRWSEATALIPYDFEDDGRTMHVTVHAVMRRDARHQFARVSDTKSDAGARRMRVPDAAAAIVRRRIAAMTLPDAFLFTTASGAQWRYPAFRERYWLPAVQAAGLASRAPTFHWLRHTHVLWMVQAGASLPELQARIGHSSIATTIGVYGRAIADVQDAPLDAFGQMLVQRQAIES